MPMMLYAFLFSSQFRVRTALNCVLPKRPTAPPLTEFIFGKFGDIVEISNLLYIMFCALYG